MALFNRKPQPQPQPARTATSPRTVPIREMVGRVASRVVAVYSGLTIDLTKADYKWYAKLRRGMQPGYELGGLFAEPIGRIQADWTLGKGVTLTTGDEYTDEALADWVSDVLDTFSEWDYEAFTLGDSYLAVNPDGSLTLLTPDVVEKTYNPLDPQETWGYAITSKPSDSVTITDTYTLRPTPQRHLVVKESGTITLDETYALVADRLPIVHLPNKREPNEIYGHPGVEDLRKLFAEYDDVIDKSLNGVKLMGNPIPAIEEAEDPEGELEANATDTVDETNSNGETITRKVIDFARKGLFLVLGKGAKFSFKSPGQFTQDAGRMLEYLFLLMLQKSRIPEWVWGGAIASSKASVDAQMPAFALFIESRQRKLERYLRDVAEIWLATRRLVDPRIKDELPVSVAWPGLTQRDEVITLQWAKDLYDRGLLSGKSFLGLSGLVDDPAAELDAAQAEAVDRQAAEEAAIQREIDRLADSRNQDDAQPVPDELEAVAA